MDRIKNVSTDTIDFDVANYDEEELLAILRFENMPTNEGKISQRIQELLGEYKDKRFKKFFKASETKLITYFKKFNEQTWQKAYEHDDSAAAKVLTQQFETQLKKEAEANKSLILNQQKNIIGRAKLPLDRQLQTKGTVQGNKNAISRDIIKRIVNFDSHYRQILDPSSVNCANTIGSNSEARLYTPTNYTVNLNQPLQNVVDLTFESCEIPNSWYVFSEDYGTSKINITTTRSDFAWKSVTLEIREGNYQATQMRDALNRVSGMGTKIYSDAPGADADGLWTAGLSDPHLKNIDFSYNSIDGRFTIHNRNSYNPLDEWENSVTINFYTPDLSIDACKSIAAGLGKVGDGGKVDYNLGWLLGWRITKTETPVQGQSTTTGLAPFDNYGPKYFLISLDDFNNNKPNKDLISLVTNQSSSFKLPKYYNNQTMNPNYGPGKYYPGYSASDGPGYECVDVAKDIGEAGRGCFEGALNVDVSSNLTKKQQYTVSQIQLARSGKGVNRYFSPNTTDLLCRIPINRTVGNYNQIITYRNSDLEFTKRLYFGPVKLSKFKVRLLNDKGFEVNLHENDWSFSIIVSQLYQY